MDLGVIEPDVRAYLMLHLEINPADFILKSHPFKIEPYDLTQQLVGLQKEKSKFPELFENTKLLYPPKVNLEQTSSSVTANYKAEIVNGKSLVDLTGGWGIDALAFAEKGFKTTHVEISDALQPYSEILFQALDTGTESVQMDGIEYAYQHLDFVDVIYMDPSRKTSLNSKAIRLEDYEPDVLEHLDLLLQKCDQLLIKTSPMLDIHMGIKQLGKVSRVHVVAVKNEVKEILWLLTKDLTELKITCVNLEIDQETFSYQWNTDQSVHRFSQLSKYLYEPNVAIMKSGAFQTLADQYEVEKLDTNAHLFTSDERKVFPGRVFEIIKFNSYKPKSVKKLYGKSARGVVTRNFKGNVKQLRTKFQFTEHDTDYLFFTSVKGLGATVIEARKL